MPPGTSWPTPRSPGFPCDGTLQQLYDATEFEAYHQLGAASAVGAAQDCDPPLKQAAHVTQGRLGLMGTSSSRPAAPDPAARVGQAARRALAAIRVINGGLALIAPGVIIGRFDEQQAASAAAVYGLRMFGIRTVLLGVDLATLSGEPLRRALREAVLIHATDTAAVVLLGVTGRAKPRTAVPLALISLTNTALAITACLAERAERKA